MKGYLVSHLGTPFWLCWTLEQAIRTKENGNQAEQEYYTINEVAIAPLWNWLLEVKEVGGILDLHQNRFPTDMLALLSRDIGHLAEDLVAGSTPRSLDTALAEILLTLLLLNEKLMGGDLLDKLNELLRTRYDHVDPPYSKSRTIPAVLLDYWRLQRPTE